ncbi:hypothetical protein ACQ4PT_060170 [Festuca glaucescens]
MARSTGPHTGRTGVSPGRLADRPASPVSRPVVPAGDSDDDTRGAVAKRVRNERPPGCRTSTRVPSRAVKQVALQEGGPIHLADWRRLREKNPYRFEERTYLGEDREFWTNTQLSIWDDFYNCPQQMRNGVIVQPKAINKEELTMYQATKYRFVVDTLKKMGLFDLVCLKPGNTKGVGVYCPILVRQFHCTVFFHDDAARTMTWMTGKEKYTCNYLDFCEAMGFGSGHARGFQIHSQDQLAHGDIAFCYPLEPTAPPPTISGMYYSYLVLAKLFRESLISKTIDGCDFLYCELKRSVRNRMTPNYAQYVQQLINTVVPAPNNKKDQLIKMEPFKIPQQGNKLEVPFMMPSEHRSKERHDPAASSSSSMHPKRGASRFLASLWQMCRNTNDVAHQSLALNQETRRRQNEFMAARNHHVPPPGPEMEPVVAPTWEMPPINDAMFQNFDLSLFAHGGALPPRTRSADDLEAAGTGDDDEENEESEEDDDEDGDGDSPPTGTEFY